MSTSEEMNTKLLDELEVLVRRLRGRELKSARDIWRFQNDIVKHRLNISKEISKEAVAQQAVKNRAQNTTASSRGSEYQRGIGDTTVLSHREARAIIRQQEKELGRDRPTPSRGR